LGTRWICSGTGHEQLRNATLSLPSALPALLETKLTLALARAFHFWLCFGFKINHPRTDYAYLFNSRPMVVILATCQLFLANFG
jgi:hypothetical protein